MHISSSLEIKISMCLPFVNVMERTSRRTYSLSEFFLSAFFRIFVLMTLIVTDTMVVKVKKIETIIVKKEKKTHTKLGDES